MNFSTIARLQSDTTFEHTPQIKPNFAIIYKNTHL